MNTWTHKENDYILTVTCRAATGIVAAITGFLAERGCYISELAQYDDQTTEKYFSRCVFRRDEGSSPAIGQMEKQFEEVASTFGMDWHIYPCARPTRVVIMVSKTDHCLDDLLYRLRKGELFMAIAAVISNHPDLRPMVEREGFRFIHLPIDEENRMRQEERMLEVVEESGTQLVILARYMQILSKRACDALHGRCINIHHSFLPGFRGARPYHQAYERGVKLIGATAHYVTPSLDEGPIIEQVVERVDHTYLPADLVATGRDMENLALARAVKYHIEHRVFIDGNKTVVFR